MLGRVGVLVVVALVALRCGEGKTAGMDAAVDARDAAVDAREPCYTRQGWCGQMCCPDNYTCSWNYCYAPSQVDVGTDAPPDGPSNDGPTDAESDDGPANAGTD
jgi:hypothetical protein